MRIRNFVCLVLVCVVTIGYAFGQKKIDSRFSACASFWYLNKCETVEFFNPHLDVGSSDKEIVLFIETLKPIHVFTYTDDQTLLLSADDFKAKFDIDKYRGLSFPYEYRGKLGRIVIEIEVAKVAKIFWERKSLLK